MPHNGADGAANSVHPGKPSKPSLFIGSPHGSSGTIMDPTRDGLAAQPQAFAGKASHQSNPATTAP